MGSSSRGSGFTIYDCSAPSSTRGKNYSGMAGACRTSLGLRCLALDRTGRGGIGPICLSDPFSLLSGAFVDGGDLLASTIGKKLTVLCPSVRSNFLYWPCESGYVFPLDNWRMNRP